MLATSVWRQVTPLGSKGIILDSLGLLPQWKFFAQSALNMGDDLIVDYHLMIRSQNREGIRQPWHEAYWEAERTWLQAFWNPELRSRGEIQGHMRLAAMNRHIGHDSHYQTSVTYLTLLRFCLDCDLTAKGAAIQFAIVTTSGREARSLSAKHVSAWHIP